MAPPKITVVLARLSAPMLGRFSAAGEGPHVLKEKLFENARRTTRKFMCQVFICAVKSDFKKVDKVFQDDEPRRSVDTRLALSLFLAPRKFILISGFQKQDDSG